MSRIAAADLRQWNVVRMSRELNTLSAANVRQALKLVDKLISDVLCRQLLPEAVRSVAEKFRLQFEFSHEREALASVGPDIGRCQLLAVVKNVSRVGSKPMRYGFCYDSVVLPQLKVQNAKPASGVHLGLLLDLMLLARVASGCDNSLRISLNALGVRNAAENVLNVRLSWLAFGSVESLLIGLLANGWDLTSLSEMPA